MYNWQNTTCFEFAKRKIRFKKLVAWVTIALYLTQPVIAAAQTVADPNAATPNRPSVESAQNGVPVVQITAPSAAGVSRNLYQQFNIDAQGMILNNSREITSTQLAGYITGNPNLAGGLARIILNEVTGANISQLKGYLEVAGQRADVIIANPNGIMGNGFGFINTSRAVLTTGMPIFGGSGSLDAFRVTGGQIAVQGAGVDAGTTDRLDIISRAVAVNAGIWAKELNSVTGTNQVTYNTLDAQKIAGDANQPAVALDVAALGGMYANKIRLVGTEQGVGFNSQGTIAAGSGDLMLTNEGKIVLAGSTSATGHIQINASDDVINQGTLYARGNTNITTTGILTNTGLLAAAQNTTLAAQTVASSGSVGAGLKSDGTVGNNGDLTVTATDSISANGQNLAGGNLAVTGTTIDHTGATTYAGGNAAITATAGDVKHTGASLQAGGTLTISADGMVQNDQDINGAAGQLAADKIVIAAGNISNKGGTIRQTGLAATTLTAINSIDNTGGTVATNGSSLSLQANSVVNKLGQIQQAGTGTLTINTTADLTNVSGTIGSNGQVNLQTGNVDNTQGAITAQKRIDISADSLSNTKGSIAGVDAISVTVQGAVSNDQQGVIEAGKGLNLTAQSLNNQDGNITSLDASGLTVTAAQNIQNQSGRIGGNGNVSIAAANLINQNGQVTAKGSLSISAAQSLDNTGGTLSAQQDVILDKNTVAVNNSSGNINAGGSLNVQAAAVDNTNGNITANTDINLSSQSLGGAGGKLTAGQDVNITSSGSFAHGIGSQIQANRHLTMNVTGTATNQGSLKAMEDLRINAGIFTTGTDSTAAAKKALALTVSGDINNDGRLDGSTVTVTGQNVDNTGTVTADKLTVQANTVSNSGNAAILAAIGDINLNVANSLENKDGATIYSGKDIIISGSAGRDAGGQPVDKTGSVLNQSATIQAVRDISISANDIMNKKRIFEVGETTVSEVIYTTPYGYPHVGDQGINPNEGIPITPLVVYGNVTFMLGQKVIEPNVIQDSPQGKVLAGNDMFLRARTVTNDVSWMLAGGTLSANTLNPVNNIASGAVRTTIRHLANTWGPHGIGGYYTIQSLYDDSNTEQVPGSTTLYGGGQAVVIQAPGVNNIIKTPGSVPGGNVATLPVANQPSVGTQTVLGINNNIMLPTNGLYTIHTNPDSHYLVETDPRFANYNKFISSDYMMNQLGIDPVKTMKLIGDGFYQQQLIRDQVAQLTGRQVLSGYSSANDEFKALMDNGAIYAKEFNLQVGIALTADQMKNLTSDMVWLVKQNVQGQEVLVPVVYLAHLESGNINPSGALISADNIQITTSGNITNSGTIKANSGVQLEASNVLNQGGTINGGKLQIAANQDILNQSGKIEGNQVTLDAGRDIKSETITFSSNSAFSSKTTASQIANINATGDLFVQAGRDITISGGTITAGQDAAITAGRNLEIEAVATKDRIVNHSYLQDNTVNVTSNIQSGGNINLTAQQDINLKGAQVIAGQDLTVAAGGNVNISVVKDEEINDQTIGYNNWTRTRTDNETVLSSNLQGGGKVTVTAVNPGGSIDISGSNISSQTGAVTITADQAVTVAAVTEKHESLVQTHKVSSGFFSSTTTNTLDQSIINQVKGSTLSGDTVSLQAGSDLTVRAGNVVATNDVELKAQGNVSLVSAKESGYDEHYRHEETSGIFGSGGFGFTIGSKSEKTTTTEQTADQVGSTIGSIAGSINIQAGNKVDSAGTTFVSGKDLNITGQEVSIDNTINTYDSQTTYEFKQSGLTVSLGGGIIDAATKVASEIRRSGQVEDERLAALYEYKAAKDLQAANKQLADNNGNLSKDISLNVSLGSSSITSEQTVHAETVNTANINAGGSVNLTATAGDLTLNGTKVNAAEINLTAARDINLGAAQNKLDTTDTNSSSSASLGWSFGGKTPGLFGSINSSNGNENETTVTHTGTVLNAGGTATLESGNDTNIIGSQVKGEKVTANIGGNLNIVSLQDTNDYTANNQSSGIGFSSGSKGGVTGSFNIGNTDSTYASVTEQSGIYAGQEGFDITVGKNTDLKGAVIASDATPDKNKLSTGTLTYSDIQNQADYSASSTGVNYDSRTYKPGDPNYKNQGLTPDIGVTASGSADSTTHSAISAGTIIVGGKEVNPANLSRDTRNSLNTLGKIFDKETVAEQQELAGLFGEEAFKAVGDLGLKEGSPEKAAVDAAVGGIMAQLGGGNFASGAAGAGFTQIAMNEISKITDPAVRQWVTYIVGSAATSLIGGNAQTGGSVSVSEIRNNEMDPEHILQTIKDNPVLSAALLFAGYVVDQQNRILNKEGQVIATWSATAGSWLDSAGESIGDSAGDLYIWAKSGGNLKKVPDSVIDQMGGEAWTQGLKEKTGKSTSDLYWDKKTGDVYSVPKNKKFNGSPEWVGNVND